MISDTTLDEIRRSWRNVFPADKHGDGIICPLCGNGSGDDGTGIDEVKDEHGLLHCFKCGFSGDVFQLYAEANNLDFRSDFRRVVSEVAGLAGIAIDGSEPIKIKGARQTPAPKTDDEPPDYTEFYARANADLTQTNYLAKRGISLATANALNIGYVARWRPSKTKSGKIPPFKAVIIAPTSKSTYMTREARDGGPGYNKKYNKINEGETHVFNERALSENETVFVVEGFFDALSIFEVGYHNVVAVNSAANFNLLGRALQAAKHKPKRLILALDNDDAGSVAFKKFDKVARKLKIAVIDGSKISGDAKDPNDLLRADRAQLEANCRRLMEAASDVPVEKSRNIVDAAHNTKAAIDGCPYDFDIPPGWFVDVNGISYGTAEASLTPVFPVRRIFHHFLKITRYVLAFFDGQKWREITVDADAVADANKALKLADHGIQTFAGASKNLVVFFNKFLQINRLKIETVTEHIQPGWCNDFNDFVLPHFNGYYAPTLEDTLAVGGDEKTWITFARLLCDPEQIKSHIPRLMLALSFAAPLMNILNIRTFMTYIWGTSLAGKTAAAKFALSAWGNPLKMMSTFRATDNGIEGAASRSNNVPLLIDERQAAEAKLDLNKLSYDLAGEQGKTRMTKTGELRPQRRWRMPVLATGEDKLIDPNTSAGAFNRTLEIPLDFNEKVFSPHQGALTHTIAETHFGHGIRLFLARLMPHRISGFQNVKDTFNDFCKALAKFNAVYSAEHVRIAALVATAFYLMLDYLFALETDTTYITDDISRRHQHSKELSIMLAEYIFSKIPKAADLDDGRRAFDFAMSWLWSYRYHFTGDHLRKESKDIIVRDPVYGHFELDSDGNYERILVNPHILRAALKKDKFPADKCIRDFRARGWIVSDKDGNNPKHNFVGNRIRMIEIPGAIANSFLKKNDPESDRESGD